MYNLHFILVVVLLSNLYLSSGLYKHITRRGKNRFAYTNYVSNAAANRPSRTGPLFAAAADDGDMAAVATPTTLITGASPQVQQQQQKRPYIPQRSFNNNNNRDQQQPRGDNNDNSNNGPRVYSPKPRPQGSFNGSSSSSSSSSSNQNNGGQSKRQYNPRGASGPSPQGGGSVQRSHNNQNNYGGGGNSRSVDKATFLQFPQLLVRYKIPRTQTDFKKQLLEQQAAFKEAADASQAAYRDRMASGGGGRGTFTGGGGGGFGGGQGGRQGGSFFEAFEPPSPTGFGKDKVKGGGKGGKGGKDFTGKSTSPEERLKEKEERRRGMANTNSDDDGEEDALVYEVDISDVESDEDEDDYYGDEGASVSLFSVPVDALRNMELEGYSLEEIQMSLYGEYGIKASMGAIKKRMMDAASDKKSRKRTGKTRRDRAKSRNARIAAAKDKGIVLPEGNTIQISELAGLMEVGGGEVVKYLMMNVGMMCTINQSIEIKVAKDIIVAFGKKFADNGDDEDEDDDDDDDDDAEEETTLDGRVVPRLSRPPVVTIMGHVDHGKTTLLDSIRKTSVAMGEAGGITQAISAFKVKTKDDQFITFIDTPGHAAFSEMRKRGANVTDIVILVVAADDGIMEQTKECIAAAKGANCPIVVAVNKIDKEGANVQQVITDLMSYDILAEQFGGEVQVAQVSAKKGLGIDELIEGVLLQTEVMNLRAAVDVPAEGTVLEARIDKGLGVVVTALVQKGTLRVGDYVLAGPSWGRVRRIVSDSGTDMKEAAPSTPVQIVGMTIVPGAGDAFQVTSNEASAREVAESRQRIARQTSGSLAIAGIKAQATGIAMGTIDQKQLLKVPILIKGDVAGSIEALRSSIEKLELSDSEAICKADVVFAGVGDVTSSDVAVAAVSKAKILSFNVAASMNAMDEARAQNVEIGYYNVVYDLLDELEATIKTTLAPPPPGTLVGRAEIKKVFKIGKVGKVAGCEVVEGLLKMESEVRVMRGKRNPVYTGKLNQLKIVKDAVQEVPVGSECGLSFEDFQDFMEGDIVECFVGGNQ